MRYFYLFDGWLIAGNIYSNVSCQKSAKITKRASYRGLFDEEKNCNPAISCNFPLKSLAGV